MRCPINRTLRRKDKYLFCNEMLHPFYLRQFDLPKRCLNTFSVGMIVPARAVSLQVKYPFPRGLDICLNRGRMVAVEFIPVRFVNGYILIGEDDVPCIKIGKQNAIVLNLEGDLHHWRTPRGVAGTTKVPALSLPLPLVPRPHRISDTLRRRADSSHHFCGDPIISESHFISAKQKLLICAEDSRLLQTPKCGLVLNCPKCFAHTITAVLLLVAFEINYNPSAPFRDC